MMSAVLLQEALEKIKMDWVMPVPLEFAIPGLKTEDASHF